MSVVKRYEVIGAEVDAIHLKEDVTKRQILDFCPHANVGAPSTVEDPEGMDSTDLKWIVFEDVNGREVEAVYDDWIVKGPAGHFLRPNNEFVRQYREKEPD